jgi:transcriptional regulator with XRE-family HTH domain
MSTESARRRVLISAWLKREGLTSRQLEGACHISRQTMTAIRRGRDVRLSTMVKILRGARALSRRRVAIEELFDFEGADGNGSS